MTETSKDFLARDFWIMLYWAKNYGGIYELPGVQTFSSIPHLLFSIQQHEQSFFQDVSTEMRRETKQARKRTLPFWAHLAARLLTG